MLCHRPKVPDISAVLKQHRLLCGSRGLSLWSKFHVMMPKPSRSLETIWVSILWVLLRLLVWHLVTHHYLHPKFNLWQFVFLCLIQKGNFFLPLCFTLRTTTTEMQIIGYTENKTPKRNNLSLPPFLLQTNKSALACMLVRQAEPFADFFSLHTYSSPTPSMSQCSELHPGTLATTHTAQIQRQ